MRLWRGHSAQGRNYASLRQKAVPRILQERAVAMQRQSPEALLWCSSQKQHGFAPGRLRVRAHFCERFMWKTRARQRAVSAGCVWVTCGSSRNTPLQGEFHFPHRRRLVACPTRNAEHRSLTHLGTLSYYKQSFNTDESAADGGFAQSRSQTIHALPEQL